MEDDVIRILVSTDNHLGVHERDAVRADDAAAAFEEALVAARRLKADFVLLAGDTFHENKPSRRALHGAFALFNKYCLGESPVYIEVLNDQREIFKANGGQVNYESPNQAIAMPVFAIHGNHDDPSREGGREALAALDLLSSCNLVNYIGKAAQVDDIEISPVLIRKGNSLLALYSLGAVRDERLNRMWNQQKVRFIRPTVEQGRDLFFNIFVVHQNRDYGRGSKNCLHECMIPEWMDLVVWGNEHESQPALAESLVGTYRIFQPGSSVACSLVEGESLACPKHMGLVEVKGRFFRMQAIPYTQVRPFLFSDICLANIPGLDPNDPKIEDQIRMVLAAKVREQIIEARRHSEAVVNGGAGQIYRVVQPEKVLVRLRVDHTGFPTINQQRFGAQFVEEVANPSSILLFSKKKKDAAPRNLDAAEMRSALNTIRGDDDEAINQIKIEDLVKELLENGHRQLNVLVESEMAQAIDNFVFKKHLSAINDAVEETLERTQQELFSDISAIGKEKIVEHAARVRSKADETFRKNQKLKPMSKTDLTIFDPRSVVGDSDGDNNSEEGGPSRGARGAAGRGGRGAAVGGRGRGGGGGGGRGAPAAPKQPAAASSRAKKPAVAAKGKGKGKRGRNEYSEDSAEESEDEYVSEEADEDDEEADDYGDSQSDISEDSDIKPKKRGAAPAQKARKSKAASSSVPASVSVPLKVAEGAGKGGIARPQRGKAKVIDVDESEEDEEEADSHRLKRARDASPPPARQAAGKRSGGSVQTRLDLTARGAGGAGKKGAAGGLTEDW